MGRRLGLYLPGIFLRIPRIIVQYYLLISGIPNPPAHFKCFSTLIAKQGLFPLHTNSKNMPIIAEKRCLAKTPVPLANKTAPVGEYSFFRNCFIYAKKTKVTRSCGSATNAELYDGQSRITILFKARSCSESVVTVPPLAVSLCYHIEIPLFSNSSNYHSHPAIYCEYFK